MTPIEAHLEVLGACPWWMGAAREGWLRRDGQEHAVAVILGPETGDAEAVVRAADKAAPWIGREADGVLTLEAVLGSAGRVAWVYRRSDGISATSLLADAVHRGVSPIRACTEIVSGCATILERMHAVGLSHPGVSPDDVLVRADGTLQLAGFVGPYARVPAHRDPRGVDDAGAAVWRLGVLFAELLTGTAPASNEAAAHGLMIRRLLVRITSQPGPVLPTRLGDWLRGMLAWDADHRPVLGRVGPGLAELAEQLPLPTLAELAARVPELRDRPAAAPVTARWLPGPETPAPSERTERTEEVSLGELSDTDDVTALSADSEPPLRPVAAPPEHGAIPVQVGPPPEVVVAKRRTRLPRELFDRPVRSEVTDGADGPPLREVGGVALALVLVAVGLVWYLWT